MLFEPRIKHLPSGSGPVYDRMMMVKAEWDEATQYKGMWWNDELRLLLTEHENWDSDLLEEAVSLFESLAYELTSGIITSSTKTTRDWGDRTNTLSRYRLHLTELRILRNKRKLQTVGIFEAPDIRPNLVVGSAPVPRDVVRNMNEAGNPWGKG